MQTTQQSPTKFPFNLDLNSGNGLGFGSYGIFPARANADNFLIKDGCKALSGIQFEAAGPPHILLLHSTVPT